MSEAIPNDLSTLQSYRIDPNKFQKIDPEASKILFPLAIRHNNPHLLEILLLLDPTLDLNQSDASGVPYLYHVCENKQEKILTILVSDPRAKVNISPKEGAFNLLIHASPLYRCIFS